MRSNFRNLLSRKNGEIHLPLSAWKDLAHDHSFHPEFTCACSGQLRNPVLLLATDSEERHHDGDTFHFHPGRHESSDQWRGPFESRDARDSGDHAWLY